VVCAQRLRGVSANEKETKGLGQRKGGHLCALKWGGGVKTRLPPGGEAQAGVEKKVRSKDKRSS